ncbi:aldehyde dehydrogenase family protein [Actinocorallia sp. B10E7]|uniref:aldehyde dehydrogenase family protein n=1 Tax=Actinocorallia sp. B10E7 TaxID=3153558 RepID=UPI00325EBBBA
MTLTLTNFIDGRWREHNGPALTFENPSTGELLGTLPDSGAAEVDLAVAAARRAFTDGPWPRMSPQERAEALRAVAAVLEARFEPLAAGLIADTGCTARLAPMLQAGSPIAHLRDFAGMAPLLEKPVSYPVDTFPGFGQWELHREPVGVVGAFTPYNFPLFMAVWKAAPALLAGNTLVIKPSPLTPFGLNELAAAVIEAGLPEGVLNIVHGDREAGQALAAHPGVDLISFTGSTAVGRQVMASAARTVKEIIMELGGKSPAIVLPDADAELAVRGTLFSSMMHSGQACVATTRMLVPDSRYEEFTELLAARAGAMVLGPATDLATDVGPVVSAAARDRIDKHVATAVEQGARVLVGGEKPAGLPEGGHYVAPTVLADPDGDTIATREETFGPVLSVVRYSDIDDAVRKANDTPYGLAASVWGTDLNQARQVASRIESGLTWINDAGAADVARTPLAGRKQSGVGTELGPDGLFAYTRVKSLYTALDRDLATRAYGAVGAAWA